METAAKHWNCCWRGVPKSPIRSHANWTPGIASASKSSAASPRSHRRRARQIQRRDRLRYCRRPITLAHWRRRHRRCAVCASFIGRRSSFGGDGDEWRGSGRSIEGFNLAAALRQCDDLLLRHGGHAMAAGLSMRPQNIDALRHRLGELARRTLTRDQLQPLLRLDAESNLSDMTLERVGELQRLEPPDRETRRFKLIVRNVRLQRPTLRMGRDHRHAKLWVTDGRLVCEVVWWGCEDAPLPAGKL